MIVPCNSDASVDFNINGEVFSVGPDAYIIGPSSVGGGQLCVSGIIVTELGKQSLLDFSAHHSHVEQISGYLVTCFCKPFTLSSTKGILKLV
jgi:hypothetical protein